MNANLVQALHAEWLKQRRSLALWLVVAGAVFTPGIMAMARLAYPDGLAARYAAPEFWREHWRMAWESVALFLLPIGCMLVTSLSAQLEYRNHAWKQLHATPLSTPSLYIAKFALVLLRLAQFFVIFNVATYLSALLPCAWYAQLACPAGSPPWPAILADSRAYFIACLPIVALQFALSVRLRNYLIALGVGFALWIATLAALSWHWGYFLPYAYTMYEYLASARGTSRIVVPATDLMPWALGYFLAFLALGYVAFAARRVRG